VTSKSKSEASTSNCTKLCSASRSKNSSRNIFVTGVKRYHTGHRWEIRYTDEKLLFLHARTHTHTQIHSLTRTLQSRNTPVSGWLRCASPGVSDSKFFSCGYGSIVLCVLIQIRSQLNYFSLAWLLTFQIP